MLEEVSNKMTNEITELVNQAKANLAQEINKSIVYVYWNIGRIIVSSETKYNNRLVYNYYLSIIKIVIILMLLLILKII